MKFSMRRLGHALIIFSGLIFFTSLAMSGESLCSHAQSCLSAVSLSDTTFLKSESQDFRTALRTTESIFPKSYDSYYASMSAQLIALYTMLIGMGIVATLEMYKMDLFKRSLLRRRHSHKTG